MLLTLSVKNHQGKLSQSIQEYNFGNTGGSIGRDKVNDWTLPDDKNFLSKKHATIHFSENRFHITDNSTNGVFINESRTALGRGNQHTINGSDEIVIGEYTLIVSQLDEDLNIKGTPSSANDLSDPSRFTLIKTKHKKPEKQGVDSAESDDPLDKIITKKEDGNYTLSSPVKHNTPSTIPNTPDDDTPDISNTAIPDSLVKSENIKAHKIQQTNEKKPNQPMAAINTPPYKETPTAPPPSSNVRDTYLPEKATINKKNTETRESKKEEINKHITESKEPQNETSGRTITDIDALTQILLNADLTIEDISNIKPDTKTCQLIGQTLKESIDGAMNLLRSRTEAKNHLRLDHTLIAQRENNPLKFLPNTRFVLKQTLSTNNVDNTYLTLADALHEAYDDISAHEYSMATCIQEALTTTIKKHFSPDSLQRKLEKESPISSKIPLKREANLWKMFTSIYDDIAEEASDDFGVLLDKEIVKAYEMQMKYLKEKR